MFFAIAPIDAVVMQETLRTHTAFVGIAYKFGGPAKP